MASTARALYNVFVRPALCSTSSRARVLNSPCIRGPIAWPRPFTSTSRLQLKKRGKSANLKIASNGLLADDKIPARSVQVVNEDGGLGDTISRSNALRATPPIERLISVMKPPPYLAPEDDGYQDLLNNWAFVQSAYATVQSRRAQSIAATKEKGQPAEEDALSEIADLEVEGDAQVERNEWKRGLDEEVLEAARSPAILIRDGRSEFIRLPSGEEWIPICKRENKAEVSAKARQELLQRKEAKKFAPEGVKIIELNWAMDVNNDLKYRLKKLQDFLEARRKVEIVIAPKKRGRKATREEAENVLQAVKATIESVQNARETKPMEGTVGNVIRIQAEGDRTHSAKS